MLLLVVLIVAALTPSLPGAIASATLEKICQIAQSDCGDEAPGPRLAREPAAPAHPGTPCPANAPGEPPVITHGARQGHADLRRFAV